MSKVKSTNPPFVRLEKALIKAKKEMAWKDLIPFVIKWMDQNTDKDDPYTVDFFLKSRRSKPQNK